MDKESKEEAQMVRHGARLIVVSLTLLGVAVLLAQAPAGPPQPGPEHKKLTAFVGKWRGESDLKPSAFGPGGKVSSTESCEWFAGGFSVVCRGEITGAIGEGKELSILSYDREGKLYTYYAINSWGETDSAKGTVEGDTWTWHGESKMGGKVVKGRFIVKELSPDSATMKYEISADGGPWNLMMEGKRSRAK